MCVLFTVFLHFHNSYHMLQCTVKLIVDTIAAFMLLDFTSKHVLSALSRLKFAITFITQIVRVVDLWVTWTTFKPKLEKNNKYLLWNCFLYLKKSFCYVLWNGTSNGNWICFIFSSKRSFSYVSGNETF